MHHEDHEEHEVKKFENINVRILRVLCVLRGEIIFACWLSSLESCRQKICANGGNF
jgi:hypothetical protein